MQRYNHNRQPLKFSPYRIYLFLFLSLIKCVEVHCVQFVCLCAFMSLLLLDVPRSRPKYEPLLKGIGGLVLTQNQILLVWLVTMEAGDTQQRTFAFLCDTTWRKRPFSLWFGETQLSYYAHWKWEDIHFLLLCHQVLLVPDNQRHHMHVGALFQPWHHKGTQLCSTAKASSFYLS